jgi:hypothetical protein
MEEYDVFEATFQPQHIDDLKPDAKRFIGKRLEWRAMWLIDEDQGGPYVGQWACSLSPAAEKFLGDRGELPQGFIWVPECDLADKRLLVKR